MKNLKKSCLLTGAAVLLAALLNCYSSIDAATTNADQQTQPISSRLAFLRAQRASSRGQVNQTSLATSAPPRQQTLQNVSQNAPQPKSLAGTASETPIASVAVPNSSLTSTSNNRTTRTASDAFQPGEGYNLFVTNTCERDYMDVTIKTSRAFYGVIHTRNQRQKAACTVEGNGDDEYNLKISHVLNEKDPAYCGVIKARKESPEDKDLLSVIIAVRVHRNIELSDDKFFLLNCTNRCRRPDCSSSKSDLLEGPDEGEREATSTRPDDLSKPKGEEECTIWKFPWLITLLWCMGILLVAMMISHCIMCSSLVCRCVKTEVEETEPSIYEGASDDEDNLYNKRNHPMRIDYDNRDIYKTSNNYEPYDLDEVQAKSRRSKNKSSR